MKINNARVKIKEISPDGRQTREEKNERRDGI
jgi:hypothetical protein